jgi:hypothetical protein
MLIGSGIGLQAELIRDCGFDVGFESPPTPKIEFLGVQGTLSIEGFSLEPMTPEQRAKLLRELQENVDSSPKSNGTKSK